MTGSIVPLAMCLIDKFIEYISGIPHNGCTQTKSNQARQSQYILVMLMLILVFVLKFGQALCKDIKSEEQLCTINLIRIHQGPKLNLVFCD